MTMAVEPPFCPHSLIVRCCSAFKAFCLVFFACLPVHAIHLPYVYLCLQCSVVCFRGLTMAQVHVLGKDLHRVASEKRRRLEERVVLPC